VACHGPNAGGTVGPNLTDKFWIHGGSAMDIHRTVDEGVVEKGMLAWGRQIGPTKVQQVVAYVLSIRNTDVDGGKPAEGEAYEGN
jgi:cytochrome c oxidase cbb3-type subunit 3